MVLKVLKQNGDYSLQKLANCLVLSTILAACRHLLFYGLLNLWFALSSWLFFLLDCLFRNGQHANDIRTFYAASPREGPMTLNSTKTLCFYSESWPQGPKTQAKWPLSATCSWGSLAVSFCLLFAFLRSCCTRGQKLLSRQPHDGLRCQNCRQSRAFWPLLSTLNNTVFYNGFWMFSEEIVTTIYKSRQTAWDCRQF